MNTVSATGASKQLYTAEETRQLDQCAISVHGIAGYELMKRAGSAAYSAIREEFPDHGRWGIVCGGGNNGGDGYDIGRRALRDGIECTLISLKNPADLKGDAARAAQAFKDSGGNIELSFPENLEEVDLVVDAMLGTGLDRPAEGAYANAIRAINDSVAVVVAIDIPSGLSADTGRALGDLAVRAELTITFIGRKRGLFSADGPDYTGRVRFFDLGLPDEVYQQVSSSGFLIRESVIAQRLKKRKKNSHKGSFGWLLIAGSDRGMSGAVRLCGEAALRSGAGKVTVVTHSEHHAMVNSACPELMVRGSDDGAISRTLYDSVDVVVLGTGLGRSEWSEAVFDSCWSTSAYLVVDADGLNILAERKTDIARQSDRTILTPHPAEAGRLLSCSAREVQADRFEAAAEISRKHQCVTILKGCGTVIANRHGQYAVCPLGNPGMASAGTGDALSGVVGALLAQGLDSWDTAVCGVVAHAAAGDLAASEIGERGMLASDLIVRLPRVLNPREQSPLGWRNHES